LIDVSDPKQKFEARGVNQFMKDGFTYQGLSLRVSDYVKGQGEPRAPALHTLRGLPKTDDAVIEYAGRGFNRKEKWYLNWFRSGKRLDAPKGPYDSPKDALKALADMAEKRPYPEIP
jgi:hypothetical protein